MVTISFDVTNCNECPFSKSISRQIGLSTNNDYILDWSCTKVVKKIGSYDFNERVEIPDFCPFDDSNESENPKN